MTKYIEKDFLVSKWTPVVLNWNIVLANWDFLVTFWWKTLKEIEDVKNWVIKIHNINTDFTVSTEYWNILVNAFDLLTKQ